MVGAQSLRAHLATLTLSLDRKLPQLLLLVLRSWKVLVLSLATVKTRPFRSSIRPEFQNTTLSPSEKPWLLAVTVAQLACVTPPTLRIDPVCQLTPVILTEPVGVPRAALAYGRGPVDIHAGHSDEQQGRKGQGVEHGDRALTRTGQPSRKPLHRAQKPAHRLVATRQERGAWPRSRPQCDKAR